MRVYGLMNCFRHSIKNNKSMTVTSVFVYRILLTNGHTVVAKASVILAKYYKEMIETLRERETSEDR